MNTLSQKSSECNEHPRISAPTNGNGHAAGNGHTAKAITGHFRILNALVDSDFISGLDTTEAKYLLIHLRLMDDNGVAFPRVKFIAEKIGVSERSVKRARQSLVARKLLADAGERKTGNQPAYSCWRLVIPDGAVVTPDVTNGVTPNVTHHAHRVTPDVTGQVTPDVTNGVTQRCAPYKDDSPIKTPIKTHRARERANPVPELPDSLNTDDFRGAWERWQIHRGEKRKKPTPSTIAAQIERCKALGVGQAIAAIDWSILNGWMGIYPEKKNSQKGKNGNGIIENLRC